MFLKNKKSLSIWVLLLPFLILSERASSQGFNAVLLGNLDHYTDHDYSDIWGYVDSNGREYAIMGVGHGTTFIDVTDPYNPVEVGFVDGPNSIWRDIKTYNHYAYVVTEGIGDEQGLQVVYLSDLPNSASLVTTYTNESFTHAHNIYIDTTRARAYVCGGDVSSNGGMIMLDISDPVAPSLVAVYDSSYTHDLYVRNDTLFACDIRDLDGDSAGLEIMDVSGDAFIIITEHEYPEAFTHNAWTTEDGKYVLTTDEVTGVPMKIWNIDDLNNITLVGEYIANTSAIVHNVFVKGDSAYMSHYGEGMRVIDITERDNPVEVAAYDTYPEGVSGYNGAWGIYPFLPSGNIIVSDIQTGLYVVGFDSVRAGSVEGLVTDSDSHEPIPEVDMFVIEVNRHITTNQEGYYSFTSAVEGNYTLIFSIVGYFPDTLIVEVQLDTSIFQNVSLEPNLADIEISAMALEMTLPVDTIASTQLMIGNVGPSGILEYTIDDINGLPPGRSRRINNNKVQWEEFISNLPRWADGVVMDRQSTHSQLLLYSNPADTIIVDPEGDLIFGIGADLIAVYATKTSSDVTFDFEFLDEVDTDSAFIYWGLDTDFDPTTGVWGFPDQDIGAEYFVFVDIPGIFGSGSLAMVILTIEGEFVFLGEASVEANFLTITVPLEPIGNDDGNMAVAGFVFHGYLEGEELTITSLDLVPDVGHGVVGLDPLGDVPWLSLSTTGGSLMAGESDTVIVTFYSDELEPESVFTGYIVVYTNDPDELLVSIPVTLTTEPEVSIHNDLEIPKTYSLEQNYPNPFNTTTTIEFSLPISSLVSLSVYDILGRKVEKILNQHMDAGRYSIKWNARNVPTGIYFVRMVSSKFSQTRKVMMLK